MTTRTSAPVAACPMLAAGRTPSPARDAARSGSMSYAVTSYPARATHPAIGCPIAPSPTQPTRLINRPSFRDRRRSPPGPGRASRPTAEQVDHVGQGGLVADVAGEHD